MGMGKMKRKYYEELEKKQKECPHPEWSSWEKDGWVHDSRHCVRCGWVQSRVA